MAKQKTNAETATPTPLEEDVLQYFNQIAGRKHKPTKPNLAGIKRVLKEGYTLQEIHEVIQVKTIEWKNNVVMSTNLNPVTVFRESLFDKYVNQVLVIKENPKEYAKYFAKINKTRADAHNFSGLTDL